MKVINRFIPLLLIIFGAAQNLFSASVKEHSQELKDQVDEFHHLAKRFEEKS